MEIQLQELIEQIKKDGVAVAENEAAQILEKAKAQADKIIADAKAEAEKYITDAKEENERFLRVSEDAIRQAGRNLLISFRESVSKELNAVIGEGVTELYSSQTIADVIAKVVAALAENNDTDDINILLNAEDKKKFEDALRSALKSKAVDGITLTPNDSFIGGFRVAVNNGTAYYDYSAEAVTEMMSAYLNPRVTELMKEAE